MDEKLIEEVRQFLTEFKKIASTKGIFVIPRKENQSALAELGLTRKARANEIMTLSVPNYYSGPEPDRNKPGNIWIFGKYIGGKVVYIKLKTAQVGHRKIAKHPLF